MVRGRVGVIISIQRKIRVLWVRVEEGERQGWRRGVGFRGLGGGGRGEVGDWVGKKGRW